MTIIDVNNTQSTPRNVHMCGVDNTMNMSCTFESPSTQTTVDAPTRLEETRNLKFRNGRLRKYNLETSQNTERIYVVKTNSFFSNVLPPTPSEVRIEYIMNDLKKEGLLEQERGMWRWAKPENSKSQEYPFYDSLNDIFHKVVSAVQVRYKLENTQSFVSIPHKSPHSNANSEEKFSPDLCFVRRVPGSITEEGIDWFYVGCPGELKVDRTDDWDYVSVSLCFFDALLKYTKLLTSKRML